MQRLVILGGGESGVGTAILGKKKGYDVFVSDFGRIKDNYREKYKNEIKEFKIIEDNLIKFRKKNYNVLKLFSPLLVRVEELRSLPSFKTGLVVL